MLSYGANFSLTKDHTTKRTTQKGHTMNRTEAKDFIKQQTPHFLEKARKTGYVCPFCGNGTGESGDGIVKDKKDPSGTHYKCFVCGEYADIIDLIGAHYGIASDDYNAKFEKAFEVYGITPTADGTNQQPEPKRAEAPKNEPVKNTPNYKDFILQAFNNNNFEYLKGRGISEATQKRFLIGYTSRYTGDNYAANGWEAIIIPSSWESYAIRNTDPNAEKENRYRKQGGWHIFNPKALDAAETVFITEGEINAMSIEEAGGKALAIGGAANANKFISALTELYTGQAFILCFDRDKAGEDAERKTKEGLNALDIPYIDGKDHTHPGANDPNEALQADPARFKNAISFLQAEALKLKNKGTANEYRAADMLDYFRNIEEQPEGLEAKTGFPQLDKGLQGGLHEGLYIIGAISSLGKTTFTLQLADQIASTGQDVLFFSLEMSKYELMAKSISRNTYIATGRKKGRNGLYIARDTAQIMNNRRYKTYSPEERQAINEAIRLYSLQAENLFIYEGRYKGERLTVQSIKEIAKKHMESTGKAPIIFVDYLQIIAPADPRQSDKQNTDTAVFELKELSREMGTAVFAISSFNRDNYLEPVNMASFKESGAVEYSSDVLFGLQYAGMDYESGESEKNRAERLRNLTKTIYKNKEQKEPVKIELKCLKNRNGYQFTVSFEMQAAFNFFEEKENQTAESFRSGTTKRPI